MNPLQLRVFGVELRDELRGAAVLVLLGTAAALLGTLHASPLALPRLAAVPLLGTIPFTLLSVSVGFQLRANAALFPLAVLSGLWTPIELLPDAVGQLARFLPTYHLAQLGLAQLGAGTSGIHLLALLLTGAAAAGVAALSYRHART
ncbi:hypothetical protein KCV87_32050 [Actinosynnema pretiosum subsp. pretiosum]|uniref:ABC transporter permease n=1 Tax=Actinosynnema pretiosum subsp. pretiosum TaxID=103721 RepID=A0AA45L6F9_9PSEU|nr:ABC-type multidrug transport system, permease component [Actinosynnema pretiosum subsp. pretiosum]QUF03938.1 hypothetical protein KCV87_32050 [Actinosynnema pretiosum subsp. pretiosum]